MNKQWMGVVGLTTLSASSIMGGCAAKQFDQAKIAEMQQQSEERISAMRETEPYFAGALDNSIAHAVFPKIGTGAFFLGFGIGSGLLFENGEVTGTVRNTQISNGYQIGLTQEYQVVLFHSPEALADFKDGDFAWANRGNAVAGKAGVGWIEDMHGGADEYNKQDKGLMAGIAGALNFYKFRPLGG